MARESRMRQPQWRRADDDRLQDLLARTSRTFALAIPLLPEPTRREVSIAYLLFRIADTFEDAGVWWARPRQIEALQRFAALLGPSTGTELSQAVSDWMALPPTDHEGYRELLRQMPAVVGAFRDLSPAAREVVRFHTCRTAEGMVEIVSRRDDDGLLALRDTADLRGYCYIVAGIVGEMLTELFVLGAPALEEIVDELRRRAAIFGEGLQLVNILKDSEADLREGRSFLPAATERAEVLALARRDLEVAAEYVGAIQEAGGAEGLIRFTALPVLLARASLDLIERSGPGSKLTRPEVFAIRGKLDLAIAAGWAAVPLKG